MALSYTQYSGNGTTRQFAVPFKYLSKSHVGVTVNGTAVSFTWLSPTMVQTTTAPANGTVVEVRRSTPRDNILVDFVDGSTLTETDLDTAALQTFFLSQEAFDAAGGTLSVNADGSFSALNRRITNTANPVNDQDVVTKKWALDTANTNVSAAVAAKVAAEAARDTAVTKASEAGSSATTANTRKGEAEAARDAAVTAKTAAEGARDSALAHKNAAETARTGAENALASLGNEVTLANAARVDAQSAAASAVSSRDSAIAAKNLAVDASTAAISAKNTAETKATEASNARDTAVTKASDATIANSNAQIAKSLAQAWAFGPINTDVDGSGTRSALHYATYCSNAWADVSTKASQVSADKTATTTAKDQAVAAKVAAEAARDAAEAIAGGSASSIVVTPTGDITATNVQAALAQLDTKKAKLDGTGKLDFNQLPNHGHSISAVTGLQTALDGKLSTAGGTIAGNLFSTGGVFQSGTSTQSGSLGPGWCQARSDWPYFSLVDLGGTMVSLIQFEDTGKVLRIKNVYGGSSANIEIGPSNNIQIRYAAGNASLSFQNDKNLVYYDTGVAKWSPSTGWVSDGTLKKNVKTLENALAKVCQLRGVTYEWKNKDFGSAREMGVIAQEVEVVYPEVVTDMTRQDGEGSTKVVAYQTLVPALIEAIKELKARVEELEAKVHTA